MDKAERLTEFVDRLSAAVPARSYDEAYGQLYRIMNEVEDERSDVDYDLSASATHDRMYPPQWDFIVTDDPRRGVNRLISVGHETYLGHNGAILIRERYSDAAVLDKPGEDGRKVGDL